MKTIQSLIAVLFGALLLAACAQNASPTPETPQAYPNQPATTSAPETPQAYPGQPAYPSAPGIEASTAVPGSVGKPLGQNDTTPASPPIIQIGADGQKIITRDAQGQTITLALGENVLLNLGQEYTWEISVADPNIFKPVTTIAADKGTQGVYTAAAAGATTVSASGDPLCRQSKPPCGMPSIQIQFTIVVK